MSVTKEKDIPTIVQQLVTTDVGGRGTVRLLTNAVADLYDGPPIEEAARSLRKSVKTDDTVVITTGFPIPPTMRQETDGPSGAVSLARSVSDGLGANPLILCEESALDVCRNVARAGEINPVDWNTNVVSDETVTIEPFPVHPADAKEQAKSVVAEFDPQAFIAVEKVGSNRKERYHNSAGYDVTDHTTKVEKLLGRLDETVPTIAVGDAGNEIGMGTIEDTVRDRIQFGAECRCGCEGGIADSTEVDVLVPATVSNWGAYGITACLSQLVGHQLLHAPETEKRMLTQCSLAGGIDGPTEKPNAWVDGLPTDVHMSTVRLLNECLSPSIHERRGEDSASAN
jgi:hypothetical protein